MCVKDIEEIVFDEFCIKEIESRFFEEDEYIEDWEEIKILYTLEDYTIAELKNNRGEKLFIRIYHDDYNYYAVPVRMDNNKIEDVDSIREAIV